MHDAICEHQKQLSDTSFVSYAKKAGVDEQVFQKDFEKPDTQKKVEDDFESGVRSSVKGTPSFFINGNKCKGSRDEEELLQYLQRL